MKGVLLLRSDTPLPVAMVYGVTRLQTPRVKVPLPRAKRKREIDTEGGTRITTVNGNAADGTGLGRHKATTQRVRGTAGGTGHGRRSTRSGEAGIAPTTVAVTETGHPLGARAARISNEHHTESIDPAGTGIATTMAKHSLPRLDPIATSRQQTNEMTIQTPSSR
jgi:hypothetical protein